MTSLAETLTAQFYAWELRGRGWYVWDQPVDLEPPFVPFKRYVPSHDSVVDDARQPHILERLFRAAIGTGKQRKEDDPPWATEYAVGATPLSEHLEYQELQLKLPKGADPSIELSEQLILSLASSTGFVAFEFIGTEEGITFQFSVPKADASACRQTLETYFPELTIANEEVLAPLWQSRQDLSTVVVDFGLSNEFMLPVRAFRSLSLDPLLAFVSALRTAKDEQVGLLQVLFQPVRPDWAVSALRAMSDGEGKAFFADAPETLALTRQKLSRPLLACCVRVGAKAASVDEACDLARRVAEGLSQLSLAQSNELIPLNNDDYPSFEHSQAVASRCSWRTGMLLSSAELAGLVHLPGRGVEVEELRELDKTTKAVPSELISGELHLGLNRHRDREREVWLRPQDRMRHAHLIGATGTGKSTLLLHAIRQDIEAGRGFALLDPHGDLAEDVLSLVSPERERSVVVFDASDEEHPVGFNVLEARTDRERELLASDLVAIFRRFSTSWGDQMTSVMGNAVMAFLESPAGGSLLDLRQFLLDKRAREQVLASLDDPIVRSFWAQQFPRMSGRPATPILTRLDTFLRPRSIRNVVCQKKSGFDLARVMDGGGIFIGKLAQGAIGEQNAHLLGSLLVAKFQQAAMARESQAESSRRPFFLYIDEFHHFMTPSVAALLSGARKYGLGLLLAHQELRQLQERDMRSAVLANAGTRICFRVGDEDARVLASGFRAFEATDLMSLGVGEAVCRVGQADWDFTLSTSVVPMPQKTSVATESRERIKGLSRSEHASEKAAVEKSIRSSYRLPPSAPAKAAEPAVESPGQAAAAPPARPTSAASESAEIAEEARVRAELGPPTPGRGGPEHKYLQSLIKSYGESRGYRATIEAPVGVGQSIDVLLEHDTLRIACEISVTTTPEHELHNVRKAFEAGIERVVVVSPNTPAVRKIEKKAREELSQSDLERVLFATPQQLLGFLDNNAAEEASRGKEVLGYTVKTRIKASGPSQRATSRAVTKTIVEALRRLREEV